MEGPEKLRNKWSTLANWKYSNRTNNQDCSNKVLPDRKYGVESRKKMAVRKSQSRKFEVLNLQEFA